MAKDVNGVEIPTFEQAAQQYNTAAAQPRQALSTVSAPDGTLLPVDNSSDLATAALSENYNVDPNELFSVKSFDGSTGKVKGSDLKEVLASGDYVLESKEETQLREDEAKYGANNLEAAALGAARALSGGLSDQFLKHGSFKTGDELRGTENANMGMSIGGEIGGTIIPAVLSGGTSLVAKGAAKVGAGVLATDALGAAAARGVKEIAKDLAERSVVKLGASEAKVAANVLQDASVAAQTGALLSEKTAVSAANLFGKSLEKAGYAANTAKSIANRMLYNGIEHLGPDAANLAVQGALQGAGRLVTEDAFGTAEFNAENLLAYAGVGSLIGGTFGAAVGAGKALVPKAADLLSPAYNKAKNMVGDTVGGLLGKEQAAMNLVDLSPSALAKARMKRPDFDQLITAEVDEILTAANPKNANEFDEALISKRSNVGKEIDSIYKETDEINKQAFSDEVTQVGGRAVKTAESVSSKLQQAADDHLASLGIAVTKGEKSALFNIADEFATEVMKDMSESGVTATKLQEYARSLQAKIYPKGAVLSTEAEASTKLLRKKLLEVVRAEQRDLVREASAVAGSQVGKGALLDRLLKANKTFSVLNEVVYNSEKSLAKSALGGSTRFRIDMKDIGAAAIDPLGGAAFKAARLALDSFAVQKRLAMGTFDNAIRDAKIATAKGLNAMVKGVKVASKAAEPSIVRSLVSSQLAVKDEDGKKIKPKNEQEAYENIVNNAMVAVTDPERVLQHSNRQTSALFEHAPNTAAAVDAKYLQVMQFIANKAKKSNKNKGVFDFNVKSTVSGFETAKMARYLDAIANPKMMLDKAASGKLSREHVEVMKSIFPEMHNAMKTQTLDFISKNKTSLKYSQKLQLGLLLDMRSHESMQPQNIRALQGLFQPEAPEAADANYNPSAVGDMSKSANLESDLGSSVGED